MTHIAQTEITSQVSEDSWRVIRKTMRLTPHTTVQEIFDWVDGINKGGIDTTANGKIEIFKVS